MITCPHCQLESPWSSRFCQRCGRQVTPTDEAINARVAATEQLFREGRHDEAQRDFEDLIKFAPYDPRVMSRLGVLYGQSGRPQDALVAFCKAAEGAPQVPNLHFNLGVACRQQGMLLEAACCFATALQLKPDYAQAQQQFNETQAERGAALQEAEDAIAAARTARDAEALKAACDRALALDPDHLNAGHLKLSLLEREGNLLPALRLARKLAGYTTNPGSYSEWLQRLAPRVARECPSAAVLHEARALLASRDLDLAMALAAGMGAGGPDYGAAITVQGAVWEARGDLEKARQAYQAALNYAPGDTEAARGIARVHNKGLDKRRFMVRDYLKTSSELYRQRRYKEALFALNQANDYISDDPMLALMASRIHLALGDYPRAINELERAVRLDPEAPAGTKALTKARLAYDSRLAAQIRPTLQQFKPPPKTKPAPGTVDAMRAMMNILGQRRQNAGAHIGPLTDGKVWQSILAQEFNIFALLGRAQASNGQPQLAIQTFQQLVHLQPQNPQAAQLLQSFMARQNKPRR